MMLLQALRRPHAPELALGGPPLSRPEAWPRGAAAGAAGGGLGGVRLLGGPFKRAQERAGRHLLDLAIDPLLDVHRVGDYVSACSLMWAATGEPAYRRRAEHVVGRLAAWLRATGFVAVRELGPLRLGLHDAHQHAGSAQARELLVMLGCSVATGLQDTPGIDLPVDRLDRAEQVFVNTVLAAPQACTWPFGAGAEDPARIGEAIFATDGDVLCVAQYIAAELTWHDKGLRVSQVTAFPERPAVRLIVRAGRTLALTLRLRHPSWCRLMTVQVNSQPLLKSHEPGRWVDVNRCWRNGDVIDVELPMHLHLAPAFPGAQTAMLMYGPMALTAAMAQEQGGDGPGPHAPAPQLPRLALRGRTLDDAVRRLGSTLRFSADVPGDGAGLELMPCHQANAGQRGLYFELA